MLTSYLVAIYKVDLKPKAINLERISKTKTKENQSKKIDRTHSYLSECSYIAFEEKKVSKHEKVDIVLAFVVVLLHLYGY